MSKFTKTICITCSLLFVFSFIGFAYSSEQLAKKILSFIIQRESSGNYSTVVDTDSGALSIGLLCWHGERAKGILEEIVKADESAAKKQLGDELYKEILSDESWSNRTLKDDEHKRIVELLKSDKSKKVQDKNSLSDVTGYINHIKSFGIKDERALMYMADFENQHGGSTASQNVAHAVSVAKNDAKKVTLDIVYNCTKTYWEKDRRTDCYEFCKNINLDSSGEDTDEQDNEKKYLTTAVHGLNFRKKPNSSSDAITKIPFQTIIKVSEISNGWAKTTYNNVTGYVSTDYIVDINNMTKGDVDFDFKVSPIDARLVLRASAKLQKLSEMQIKVADIDKDGKITPTDARAILRASAKLQKL